MKLKLVKLLDYTGRKTTIYSLLIEGENITLFERFIKENWQNHLDELQDIRLRLQNIGRKYGAREQFFKVNEGKAGDLLCALYDLPEKKLRLYCIRLGSVVLVLGGGGAKNVRSLQEDPKLMAENYLLRYISNEIYQRLKDKDLKWSSDGMELLGDLNFDYDETNG